VVRKEIGRFDVPVHDALAMDRCEHRPELIRPTHMVRAFTRATTTMAIRPMEQIRRFEGDERAAVSSNV
jgi:hypothetical protein